MSDGTSEVAVAMVELAEVMRGMQEASAESLEGVSDVMTRLAERVAEIARTSRAPAPANDGSAKQLADALRQLRIEPRFDPTINLDPTINVPVQPLAITVAAPAVSNNITVENPRGGHKVKVNFLYVGDRIVGADIEFGV